MVEGGTKTHEAKAMGLTTGCWSLGLIFGPAFGGLLANIPGAGLADPGGILYFFYSSGIETTAFPLIIFMGVVSAPPTGPNINGLLIFEKNDGNL